MTKFIQIIFISLLLFGERGAAESIAIIGDSLSTGAASHPDLTYDSVTLIDILNGKKKLNVELQAPTRLKPSLKYDMNGMDWMFVNFLHQISSRYFDTEEYSWGYFVGRALKVEPPKILLASENGSRISDIPALFERINSYDGEFPQKIFILFTGNDFCAQSIDQIPDSKALTSVMKTSLEFIARESNRRVNGLKIYILSPLRIFDLISSSSILAKSISAFGKKTTCQDLRENNFMLTERPLAAASLHTVEETYLASLLPPHMPALCPTLFSKTFDQEKVIGQLANRVRSLKTEYPQMASDLNDQMKRKGWSIRFEVLTKQSDLEFTGEEIANDCFHLSLKGQERLSRTVFSNLSDFDASAGKKD